MCHPIPHEAIDCRHPCEKRHLGDEGDSDNGNDGCPHPCPKMCFEDCGVDLVRIRCTLVKRVRSCGHEIELMCHLNVESTKCTAVCGKAMESGCGQLC